MIHCDIQSYSILCRSGFSGLSGVVYSLLENDDDDIILYIELGDPT